MAFEARVLRVMIASPGDVQDERQMAVAAIQAWNDANAAERQIVLLPLRWETHATPTYNVRPQENISRQVVDQCDFLVGIFWTRIGTPTGTADSGTLEEIEEVAKAGKPVMLYFSSARQSPDEIDPEQLVALRKFKESLKTMALIENYTSIGEFRDKLYSHLTHEVKKVVASASAASRGIELEFADPVTGVGLGSAISLTTMFLDFENFGELPDYISTSAAAADPTSEPTEGTNVLGRLARMYEQETNPDYYRQRAAYFIQRTAFETIRFKLTNKGNLGVRDIHIDLRFRSSLDQSLMLRESSILLKEPPPKTRGTMLLGGISYPSSPDEVLGPTAASWGHELEVQALQPQRSISPDAQLVIGSRETCDVEIEAKIYADILPAPLERKLTLHIDVDRVPVSAQKFMDLELNRKEEPAGE